MKGIFEMMAVLGIIILLLSCGENKVKPTNYNNLNSINPVTRYSKKAENISLTLIKTLEDHYLYVFYVSFSPDERLIASGSADKTVIINDCSSWKVVNIMKENYYDLWGIPVKFSPDGNYIVYGSYETLKIVSVRNFKEITNAYAHKKGIQSLDISPNGQYIISAGVDGQLRVWGVPDLKPITNVLGHDKEVWSTCISADGKFAVSGGEDGFLKVWKFPSLELQSAVKYHKKSIEYVSISPLQKYILCASADSTISIWKWGEYQAPYRVLTGHKGSVPVAIFSSNENLIFSGGQDDCIDIFDIEKGTMIYNLKAHNGDILTLCLSPDGKFLASGSRDRTVKVWQFNN
jgi:WD40 repeat protein